jgi:hypothetical protein
MMLVVSRAEWQPPPDDIPGPSGPVELPQREPPQPTPLPSEVPPEPTEIPRPSPPQETQKNRYMLAGSLSAISVAARTYRRGIGSSSSSRNSVSQRSDPSMSIDSTV